MRIQTSQQSSCLAQLIHFTSYSKIVWTVVGFSSTFLKSQVAERRGSGADVTVQQLEGISCPVSVTGML